MSVERLADHKRRRRRRRRGSSPPSGGDGGDTGAIRVVAGALHDATDGAERALVAAGPGPIYQRGGDLVHIARRPERRSDDTEETTEAIVAVQPAALREALSRCATFERFDGRAKDWRPCDPPKAIVEAYFARAHWALPALRQIIASPTLRADGSLLARHGYDARTGLFLVRELEGLCVPEAPSEDDARRANDLLVEPFRTFPFSDKAGDEGLGLAVAMAGLLGAILRPTLPAAPLIAVTAPESGTGKSYLVNCQSVIATGERAIAVATGTNAEEFEKALGAALLGGQALLLLDNLSQPLGGQLVDMCLTEPTVLIRVLGLSKVVRLPSTAALFSTGNNLVIRGDTARRAMICKLDAGIEHPEEREFEGDLLEELRRRRGELVAAALTILRWGHIRRDPPPPGRRLAGFDAWCRRVRDPLVALGHVDPVRSLDLARASDQGAENLGMLMEAWAAVVGDARTTVADLIGRSDERDVEGSLLYPELKTALTTVAPAGGGGIDNRRLGNWVAKNEGRVVAGRVFRRDGTVRGVVLWKVEKN